MVLVAEEIRTTRDALRYGFAAGKVRVLATRILDGAAYERIVDARDFAECKRLLSDTVYGKYLERAETPAEVERGLSEALEDFYGFLSEAQLPEVIEAFFRVRYDFDNLRAALKARVLGVSVDDLLVEHGSVDRDLFKADLSELPEPFATVAGEVIERGDAVSGRDIDAAVDAAFFAERMSLAKRSRSARLLDIAEAAIDLANIKSLLRGALSGTSAEQLSRLLIEGGSLEVDLMKSRSGMAPDEIAESLSRVPMLRHVSPEELVDPETMDTAIGAAFSARVHRGWGEQSGPDPVISYVGAREGEVRVLRILLLGALLGTDRAVMRQHVRRATGRW